ncbi:MAG: site-2 protease family protein [Pyrinomonadaceae bacterium]|nr:site-2 protease family protein [Pyrinomonadaceae bacterium]MCX7640066.1 site-2 protease family protein [Pyrinomonadaceae bacterium]MDW8304238.1 site-2 protease family protein [Acidobacteriota bacterium]
MEVNFANLISHLVIYIVVLLLAVSAHEAGHAWMSYKFGDDTAYMLGRVTLNPAKHTDPIGTLLIPIMMFIFGTIGGALGQIPLIGWGKPTPVNPNKWTNYRLANFMVSIAGVAANLLLLIIAFIIAKIMIWQGFDWRDFFTGEMNPFVILISNMMLLNLSLFVFNLLPIPPLDGGKILSSFLPQSFNQILLLIEQFGFIILLLFVYFGLFSAIIKPFLIGLIYLLAL